jgi:hypothetical protein
MQKLKINQISGKMLMFLKNYKIIQTYPLPDEVIKLYRIDKQKLDEKHYAIKEKEEMLKQYNALPKDMLSQSDIKIKEALIDNIKELEERLKNTEITFQEKWEFFQQWDMCISEIEKINLYESYKKCIPQFKRGQFYAGIKQFAEYLGVKEPKESEVRGTGLMLKDDLCLLINYDNEYVPLIEPKEFNELFLKVFCDLFIRVKEEDIKKYENMINTLMN